MGWGDPLADGRTERTDPILTVGAAEAWVGARMGVTARAVRRWKSGDLELSREREVELRGALEEFAREHPEAFEEPEPRTTAQLLAALSRRSGVSPKLIGGMARGRLPVPDGVRDRLRLAIEAVFDRWPDALDISPID